MLCFITFGESGIFHILFALLFRTLFFCGIFGKYCVITGGDF